jgi:eukaryotic-like serine/threonine-protein kinase
MDQPPRIGRYALVRRVGAGGFATVWLARDEELDAEVAVKILSDLWVDDGDVRRRFLAEGRFLRRVDSLYVVGVHDVGETDDGRPYLVLTYADGGSLADRIKDGSLEITEAVRIITQVGRGLKHLHTRGVLHRDVKPGNILFRTDEAGDRAMLGDLGLGKAVQDVSQLTMPGGTPAYVAPEQVRGERLDHRADLYSLGAVAYAAFTGQAPHGVVSLGAVMHIDSPPPSMTTVREDVPDAIDCVVRRALEPDRDKRWQDLDSFLDALREAHTTGKIPPGLVPAQELPAAAPESTDPDQETAPAAPSQETAPATSGQETAPATSAPASPGEATVGTPPRRSGRARVVAVVLALLLAAGGGYGGYRYVLSRPVKVVNGSLSVEVPRDWSQKAASPDKLVVSENMGTWSTDSRTEGVFVGVTDGTSLPPTTTAPQDCFDGISRDTATQDTVTFRFGCEGPTVVERFQLLEGGKLLRVQVREADDAQRQAVLTSAKYAAP